MIGILVIEEISNILGQTDVLAGQDRHPSLRRHMRQARAVEQLPGGHGHDLRGLYHVGLANMVDRVSLGVLRMVAVVQGLLDRGEGGNA
jgi:hypothetical protein